VGVGGEAVAPPRRHAYTREHGHSFVFALGYVSEPQGRTPLFYTRVYAIDGVRVADK
jgi:hypothetical protein